jgi:hypothetical protein
MIQAGYFMNPSPSQALLITFSLIGGALAGVLIYPKPKPYIKSIILGIVWGLGVFLCTSLYIAARQGIARKEEILPFFIGSLPAMGLYYLRFSKSDL